MWKWFVDKTYGIYERHRDRKLKEKELDVKLAKAEAENLAKIELSNQELNLLRQKQMPKTIKDDVALYTVLSFLWVILAGMVMFLYTGDDTLMKKGFTILKNFKEYGIEYGQLLMIAIGSSLGGGWVRSKLSGTKK